MNLPGFPDATKANAHTLKYKYDWNPTQLKWLDDNWIKIGEELGMGVYSKPYYYYLQNGYGEKVLYNGKHVIYGTQKSLSVEYQKKIPKLVFDNGFCDIGDCIVANEYGVIALRTICQVGY